MDSRLRGNDGRRNEPLLQPPVMEPDHPVHLRREPLIVGGDESGRIMLPHQPQELGEHHIGGVLVEVACRLVGRSEEHTSELQSLMRISYAVFSLNKNKHNFKQYYTQRS